MLPYHLARAACYSASGLQPITAQLRGDVLARLPRAHDQWNYSFVNAAHIDLAQDGYIDLQRIDPFRREAHSDAHELSHLAMLLKQHLQYTLLTPADLHPTWSQQGDAAGRRETMHQFPHFPRASARMKLAPPATRRNTRREIR